MGCDDGRILGSRILMMIRRLRRTFVAGTADLDRSSLGSPWY